MKAIIFTVVFFFSLNLFSQTNIGFAKAGGLQEAIACSTQAEALDRFILGLENKVIAPFFSARISQSWDNAEKLMNGSKVTHSDIIKILKYVKAYPGDMAKYGVSVYKLPAGTYTFETLTLKGSTWVQGKEISRSARQGEWVLEWWGQKIASSWCLNLFGSVGEIQQPKEKIIKETVRIVRDTIYDYSPPSDRYKPAPVQQFVQQEQPCTCWRVYGRRSVKSNYGNRWYGTDNNYFDGGETHIGYFTLPAGEKPVSTRQTRWEQRALYMCQNQGSGMWVGPF